MCTIFVLQIYINTINILISDDPVPQEIKDSEDPKERFLWLYNNIEEILTK